METSQMLSIEKAFTLYETIGKYVPEEIPSDLIEFIGKILQEMIDSGEGDKYLQAVELMTDISIDDLVQMKHFDVVKLFVDGLVENDIFSLRSFCEALKNNG